MVGYCDSSHQDVRGARDTLLFRAIDILACAGFISPVALAYYDDAATTPQVSRVDLTASPASSALCATAEIAFLAP